MRRAHSWSTAVLLGPEAPIPVDRPFTTSTANAAGVSTRMLGDLVERGLVRRVLHGVLVATQVPDSLRLRAAALKLVVPEHAVVVDRTACWLHGVDALARSAIHEMPPLDVFSRSQSRMRRGGVASGIRDLLPRDTEEVEGLRVTTALRTACDVGRRLWRYDAIGALDGLLKVGVSHDELLLEIDRFKGHRGVRQLRELAPLADMRSESPPEAALRLHWIEAELPPPEPQIWVEGDDGVPRYRIDVGHRETRYGAEYFGSEFHGDEQRKADEDRLEWLRDRRAWTMDVFDKNAVYGRRPDPFVTLRDGFARARAQIGLRAKSYVDLGR
jgi:hypothetical protein